MTIMTTSRRRRKKQPKQKEKKPEKTSAASVTGGAPPPSTNGGDNTAFICAVFGFLLYANAIWMCGFCYDDRVAIEENPDVLNNKGMETASWLEIFDHDYWGTSVTDASSHKSYRPLAILSFRFDVRVAQTLGVPGAAWVFHFMNALLYALTCWLVVKVILSSSVVAPHQQDSQAAILLAGLWFTAHPVHVESVTGLVGRADLLAAILSILGTKFHSNGRTMACIVCFAAACLCKETSVVIPTVLAVANVVKILLSKRDKRSTKTNLSIIPALVAVSIGYILFRSWLFGGSSSQTLSGKATLTDNFVQHLPPGEKLRTAIWIQVKYIRLLVYPNTLSCDYGLGVIDPIRSWASFEMVQNVPVAFVLILWARYGIERLRKAGDVVPLLALGWTFGPLVPASHMIVDIGTVMAERLLFLPSIGAATLLCHALGRLGKHAYLTRVAVVACVVVFSFKAVTRNPDWSDSLSLFKADLETYPRSLKMLVANIKHADIDEVAAIRYEEVAQGILEENSDLFSADAIEHVRGKILLRMADLNLNSSDASEAVEYADMLIEKHETGSLVNVKAHAKKGRALLKIGAENNDNEALQDAAAAYRLATKVGQVVDDEYWFDIQEGKGQTFYLLWRSTGDPKMLQEAVDAFRIVQSLGDVFGDDDGRWSDTLFITGKTLFALGVANNDPKLMREATSAFSKAVKIGNVSGSNASWADLHEEFGLVLLKLGPMTQDLKLVKKAAAAFRISLEYGDTESQVHVVCRLATALAMLNEKKEAQELFQECFRRESERGESYQGLWDDRFGYRVNYAVLMQHLSGVASKDAAAMKIWGKPAIEAIDLMLNMSRKDGGASVLPMEQLQRWDIKKRAISEQLDLADRREL